MSKPLKISVVLDPRFPGGTASAVAQELPVLQNLGRVEIHAISSKMFEGKPVNPTLKAAVTHARLELIWDKPVISGDLIVLHNPAFLKFNTNLNSRLVAQNLIVVTHENFTTPTGAPGFDFETCLSLIDDASLSAGRYLAPVSDYNRETVSKGIAGDTVWELTSLNWHNICNFEVSKPVKAPKDRRGRHSRPGFEKFPAPADLELLFPAHAEHCAILGADSLAGDALPSHITLHNFRTRSVAEFLDEIDFFVYFTNPGWRESFGRVLAEATAAGKLVICDPATAQNFGDGIVGAAPEDVDGLIAEFIANPRAYADQVKRAQETLKSYAPEKFAQAAQEIISDMSKSSLKAAE